MGYADDKIKDSKVVDTTPEPTTPNPTTPTGNGITKIWDDYKVEVKAKFKELESGAQRNMGFTGTRGDKPIRTGISLDINHAQNLNRSWFTKGTILIEQGDETKEFTVTF